MSTDVHQALVLAGKGSNVLESKVSSLTASQTPDAIFPLSRLADDRPSQRFIFPASQEDDWIQVDVNLILGGSFDSWSGGLPGNFTTTLTGTGTITQESTTPVVSGSSAEMANGANGNVEVQQDIDVQTGRLLKLSVYTETSNADSPVTIEVYNKRTGDYLDALGAWTRRKVNAVESIVTTLGKTELLFSVESFATAQADTSTLQVRVHMDSAVANRTFWVDDLFILPRQTLSSFHSHNVAPAVRVILARSDYSLGATAPVDHSIRFTSSGDYLSVGGDPNGSVDSAKFTLSVWFQCTGRAGQRRTIIRNSGGFFLVELNASNQLHIFAQNAAATTLLDHTSTTTFLADDVWHNAIISVDVSTATLQVYIDDSLESMSGSIVNGLIDFTRSGWTIGDTGGPANGWEGEHGHLWLYQGIQINISTTANRRLFINGSGNWVQLGDRGELVAGSDATLYLFGSTPAAYAVAASGGITFTINGTPTTGIAGNEFPAESQASFVTFAGEYQRFYRIRFQGTNQVESVSVGQWAVGDPLALLRNPIQQEVEIIEAFSQQQLETAFVAERWNVKKEKLRRRGYRLRFRQTDEQQQRWVEEFWYRSEFGGRGVIFVPSDQESVVLHCKVAKAETSLKKRTADIQTTNLDIVESPHGIVTS